LAIFNSPRKQGYRLIAFFVIGYIVYEIVQPLLPKGIFDWLDIYGTVLGGLIGWGFYLIIHALTKDHNKIFYRF
jgi:glycopeptide antibiotics resistance protein